MTTKKELTKWYREILRAFINKDDERFASAMLHMQEVIEKVKS